MHPPLAPEVAPTSALRDLPLDGRGPVYLQIYRAVREAILSRRASPGTRLPPTRALARELGVSRHTVVNAFEQLRAEGYIRGRTGAGTFVAEMPSTAPAQPRSRATSNRRSPEGEVRVDRRVARI